jgi:ComF family protein
VLTQLVNRVYWLRAVADFAFPPLCLGCGVYEDSDEQVCDRCLDRIDTFDFPICLSCERPIERGISCPVCRIDSLPLVAYGNYVDPLKEIVISFKFRGLISPASLFARLLTDALGPRIESMRAECLVPVPLHPAREYHRGYNQAALFARELSPLLSIPCQEGVLARTKKRRPQARLAQRHRRENIRGVFKAVVDAGEPTRVLLVDDVVTSGATVMEARHELERHGYEVAGVLAIAHGI